MDTKAFLKMARKQKMPAGEYYVIMANKDLKKFALFSEQSNCVCSIIVPGSEYYNFEYRIASAQKNTLYEKGV